MAALTFEQIEDLDQTNFELALDESARTLSWEEDELSDLEKMVRDEIRACFDRALGSVYGINLLDFSPRGLKELFFSRRAVSKVQIEPLRQPVNRCCPKYGLILSLCQKARAPPACMLFSVNASKFQSH